jgi:hypothetical protein
MTIEDAFRSPARNGGVPGDQHRITKAGLIQALQGLGSSRSVLAVRLWLRAMEAAFAPVRSWLP